MTSLLLSAAVAVVALVVLIARFRLNAFLALVIASLFMGVSAGMNLPDVAKAFQDGVGAVLGSVAPIVGLGTILGKLLMESGGAEVIAHRLIRMFGEKRLPWTMLLLGLIVGLPTWFSVGVVLLVPILFTVYRETKKPFLSLAIPMVSGLSVMHGFVPPHPGPVVAIKALNADMGKVILWSLAVGVPTAIIAGPLLTKLFTGRMSVVPQLASTPQSARQIQCQPPGFTLTLFTIFLPIALMLFSTLAEVALPAGTVLREILTFIGSPVVALLIGVMFSMWSFGGRCGFDRVRLGKFVEESLGPVATVLLVVGAGGGFNRVLLASGVGDALAASAKQMSLSPLLLGWVAAALIRVATGSATVAITTAAGIMLPVITGLDVNVELLIVSMAAGSLTLSHLNDGGFWFVKEYFGMSVTETLKTWTVMETVISVVALALVLLINSLL